MKWLVLGVLIVGGLVGEGLAQGAREEAPADEESDKLEATEEELKLAKLPPLPRWSPSDFEKVKKGEIVAGRDFFGDPEVEPESGPSDLPEEQLPPPLEDPDPEESVTEIGEEYLGRYFSAIPSGQDGAQAFLVDPQELLARQEFRDRESFLAYHSGESKIDMFVYLFDDRQELPESDTIASVYERLFANYGPVALVFYHLGMPDRAQIHLSDDIRAVISQDEQNRALRAAKQEAYEKSDVAYQLDNFLVELSIRLYWIERELDGAPADNLLATAELSDDAALLAASGGRKLNGLAGSILRIVAYLGAVALIGVLGHVIIERRVRHVFPEVEIGPLLGAPHAAGVGAVVSFSSSQLPPAQQRDQVPDYLQRM